MFIVSLFWALVRVFLFVCFGFGLLRVTKTRLRHVPTRRTRIPRQHGETTLWLERLVNAVIDMMHSQARMDATTARQQQQDRATQSQLPPRGAGPGVGANGGSSHSATVPVLSNTMGSDFAPFSALSLGSSAAPQTHRATVEDDRHEKPPHQDQTQRQQQQWPKDPSIPGPQRTKNDNEDDFFDDEFDEPDDPDRPPFLAQLEERVNALLEDSGIAAWSDFRIRSLGEQPPRVKAIHIIHAGMTQAPPPSNSVLHSDGGGQPSSTVNPADGINSSGSVKNAASPRTGTPEWDSSHATATALSAGNGDGGGRGVSPRGGVTGGGGGGPGHNRTSSVGLLEEGDTFSSHRRSPQQTHTQALPMTPLASLPPARGSSGSMAGGSSSLRVEGIAAEQLSRRQGESGMNGAGPATSGSTTGKSSSSGSSIPSAKLAAVSSNPTTIELEAEIEYAGGLDFSLRADVSFMRGRQLPFQVRFNKVKYVRAHIRAVATLQHEVAGLDSPAKSHLVTTVWLESDPAFDLTMRTAITRLSIRNFFLLPVLLKFFLLRFIRAKMKRSKRDSGITVKIPLPEGIIDGGDLWRFGGGQQSNDEDDLNDTGRSTRAPTPMAMHEGGSEASPMRGTSTSRRYYGQRM